MDLKISQLPAGVAITDDDLLVIVNDPAGVPVTQKITFANFKTSFPGGVGPVGGPASSTDNAIVRWDGAGGTTVQNSAVTVADTGTTTFPDNAYAVFGTTNPFSIGSLTTTTPDYGVLTANNTSKILALTTEANKAFDFINNAAILAPAPMLLFTSEAQNRNTYTSMGMDGSVDRQFTIRGGDGDDVDGTARNATGIHFIASAGTGGTLGGAGGDVVITAGDGTAAGVKGGDVFLLVGAEGSLGLPGHFEVSKSGAIGGIGWTSNSGFYITGSAGDTLLITQEATQAIIASDTDQISARGTWLFEMIDNTAPAFQIKQGTDNYISIDTTDSAEIISYGNSTIPQLIHDFIGGYGTTTFSFLTQTGNGGLVSGGDFSFESGGGGLAGGGDNAGDGGNWTVNLGAGGIADATTLDAGNGGLINYISGAGGNANAGGSGSAGIGGQLSFNGGVGGNGTAAIVSGAGGSILFTGGNPGNDLGGGAGDFGSVTFQSGGGFLQLTDSGGQSTVTLTADFGSFGVAQAFVFSAGTTFITSIGDNSASAFVLRVGGGAEEYINVDTTNTVENINFGNTTTDPTFTFRGTGMTTFGGAIQQNLGTSTAAANDLILPTDGNTIPITGNTQINAIDTTGVQAGRQVILLFSGTPTVKHNTAGGAGTASIFLANSVDMVAAADTILGLVYDGTQFQECFRKFA